jgi:thioesterase domain-containing protein/acyl carrier protein
LEHFLISDRRRGLDLQSAPLFRCTLIRETEARWIFCWSTHHILMDGWSSAILFKEIFEDYLALALATNLPERPAPNRYRDYIDWFARQDRAAAEAWWRAELRGFLEPTPLPRNPLSPAEANVEGSRQEQSLLLDEAFTARLQAQLRAHRLTLNVLLRGAWAALLSSYSNTDDVVFGVVVSGRPPALQGVEGMVGLFIQTLPVRVRIEPGRPFLELLTHIQVNQTVMDLHGAVSLVDIQKWSELAPGAGLFESLLVVENYPVATQSGLDPAVLRIDNPRSFDQTHYPLVVTVVPGARLQLRIAHDPLRFPPDAVQHMLGHLFAMLEKFAANPACFCGELTMLAADEAFPITSEGEVDRDALARAGVAASPAPEKRMTPRNHDEVRLLAIWEEVLGRGGIGLTDDYFDLGGHSLIAVRLMGRIEEEFHRRLPIAELFRNPTIEALAAALRDSTQPIAPAGLVEIRSGRTAPPLFLLPGAGGNVLYFRALASRLAPGRAIYGLPAPGLDGTIPPGSIEEIAVLHLERIHAVVGSGPCVLAGHSFGSAVALEMSRQRIARGDSIERLVIFDSTAPVAIANPYWSTWDDTEWLVAIAHEIGVFLGVELRIARGDLEALAEEQQLSLILDRIAAEGDLFAGAGSGQLSAYLRVYQANFRAVYVPPVDPLPLPIALFRASESSPEDFGPSPEVASLRLAPAWGWSQFSTEPVEAADVPGNHLTMLLEPSVAALAPRLDVILRKVRNVPDR